MQSSEVNTGCVKSGLIVGSLAVVSYVALQLSRERLTSALAAAFAIEGDQKYLILAFCLILALTLLAIPVWGLWRWKAWHRRQWTVQLFIGGLVFMVMMSLGITMLWSMAGFLLR